LSNEKRSWLNPQKTRGERKNKGQSLNVKQKIEGQLKDLVFTENEFYSKQKPSFTGDKFVNHLLQS
jgi:hypothetical protein